MELKIYKLKPDAPNPKYATASAACFDLAAFIQYQAAIKCYSTTNDEITMLVTEDPNGRQYIEIPPEWRALIPTGLIFDIPDNFCVKVYPRSGLSIKQGLTLINCVGIIDSDYVEQVYIPVHNNSLKRMRIYTGDRIAQAEIVKVEQVQINFTEIRPSQKTDRNGGFGSTGVEI